MRRADVFGVPVAATSVADACAYLAGLVGTRKPAYVCFANVHLVELAQRDAEVLRCLAGADLVLPDGAPIAWAARSGERVTGSDVFEELNTLAGREGHRVFLLGATSRTLADLRAVLESRYPGIDIVGTHAPPHGPVEELDLPGLARMIEAAQADIVWIGLGAPKQELAMDGLRPLLGNAVLLGVGAVFDFASGRKTRAPALVQRLGFEWLHRLASEPRRLWRRYLLGNARFVLLVFGRALRTRRLRG